MGLLELLLGKENPAAQWAGANQNTLGGLGQYFLSGLKDTSGIGQGKLMDREVAQQAEQKQQADLTKNQTLQYLRGVAPDLAQAVETGAVDPGAAWMENFKRSREGSGADETFFGNPIPYQGPDGQIQFGQIGNRGTFKPIDLGASGGQFVSPTKTVNTETEQIVMDQFGNTLSRIPIQNEQAAFDTNLGAGLGSAAAAGQVAAPGDVAAGQTALGLLNQIREHPALKSATGATAPLNQFLVGTENFDFQNLVDQAKSGAFLTAIQQMRGLGALSNAEGQSATAAVTRMNTASTADGFKRALDDYETIINQGIQRAQSKLPGGAPAAVDYKTKYGLE